MKTRIILRKNTVEFIITPPRKPTQSVLNHFNKTLAILNIKGKKQKTKTGEIRINVPI